MKHSKDIFIAFCVFIIRKIKTVQCDECRLKHFIFTHGSTKCVESRVGYSRVFQQVSDVKSFFGFVVIHDDSISKMQEGGVKNVILTYFTT